MGGLDSHDGICRALANSVPCVVVSIDYRCAMVPPYQACMEHSKQGWLGVGESTKEYRYQ